MKHLKGHQLAAVDARRGSARKRKRHLAHLQSCARCRDALVSVQSTRQTMREIAEESGPTLPDSRVFAQIRLAVGNEAIGNGAATPLFSRKGILLGLGAVACGSAVGIVLWQGQAEEARQSSVLSSQVVQEYAVYAAGPQTTETKGLGIAGLLTLAAGPESGAIDMGKTVVPGDSLGGKGQSLAMQFGPKSALRLAKGSRLQVNSLNRKEVRFELQEGEVFLDIGHRYPGQVFEVRFGNTRVRVKGTAFRVVAEGASLRVECLRGRVWIGEDEHKVEVDAGFGFRWRDDATALSDARVTQLKEPELTALQQMDGIPMLSDWGNSDGSIVEIDAAPEQGVALDGTRLGQGQMRVRASVGRHQVARVDSDGVVSGGAWLSLDEGKELGVSVERPSNATAAKERPKTSRKSEFLVALDQSKAKTRCLRSLVKKGMQSGTFFFGEVGFDSKGQQLFANVLGSNLGPTIQGCLQKSVDAIELAPGKPSEFQFRLRF